MISHKNTQCNMILGFLKLNGSITPIQALEYHGCMRLGARIHDLRKKGYLIETDIVHQNGKQFAKYIYRGHRNDLSA